MAADTRTEHGQPPSAETVEARGGVGNLGGLVVAGVIGFTVDHAALSYVLLGLITLLVLPALRSLVGSIAALPSVRETRGEQPTPLPS